MTRLSPLQTSLKALNITVQSPQETLLGTPVALPTSEPSTPQIGYTVAEADLPTFDCPVYSKKWVAWVFGGGKFTTAGTLYWRMKKNGGSVSSSSGSVSANNYYTLHAFFYDVAVDDVLELALWSNQSDSNWDYKAYFVLVTRLMLTQKPRMYCPLTVVTVSNFPTLTLGNPSSRFPASRTFLYHEDVATVDLNLTFPFTFDLFYPKSTYGLVRTYYGDRSYQNSATLGTHASYRPYYYIEYRFPTSFKLRELRL